MNVVSTNAGMGTGCPNYITHYFSGKDYMLKTSVIFLLKAAVITDLKETGKRVWVHSGYLRDRQRV